ncbi:MAG: DUF5676 family membrane protein [Alphaproteobacteria bacterium]
MAINANKLAIATATVFGVLWIICSALVAMFPGPMLRMTAYMVHAEPLAFQWSLSLVGFVWGLVLWSVLSGLIVWMIARFYNRIAA